MTQGAIAGSDSEQARRRQIIRAVIECVADGGIDGATMRRVAERAGVSTGMVSYYYRSKKELIAETLAAAAQDFNLHLTSLLNDSYGPQRLDKVGELLISNPKGDLLPMAFWLEFWSEATREEELRRFFLEGLQRNIDYFRRSLDVAKEQGRFPAEADADLAVTMISSLIRGLNIEASLGRELVTPQQALRVYRFALSLLFGGMDFEDAPETMPVDLPIDTTSADPGAARKRRYRKAPAREA